MLSLVCGPFPLIQSSAANMDFRSGYALNPPSTTVDSRRPAYGGTCYSSVTLDKTYTVTAYNASTVTATQAWPATNSLDQIYAHVIEGYALELRAATVSKQP